MKRPSTCRPAPASLAAYFSRNQAAPLATFDNHIFQFTAGRWQPLADDGLEAQVARWLGAWSANTRTPARRRYALTQSLIRQVTAAVRGLAAVVPAAASERPIAIATGEPAGDLVAAGEVIAFDRAGHFTRSALTRDVFGLSVPVRLNAHARCPLLDAFLEDAIGDPRQIDALLRWLAAVLVPSRADANTPRHLLLAGPADTAGWAGRALGNLILALASPSAYAMSGVPRRTPLRLTVERAIEAANGGRACRFPLRGASPKLRAELDAVIESAANADTAPRLIVESRWSVPAAALPHRYVPPSTLRIDMRDTELEHEVAQHGRDELAGLLAAALRAGGVLGGLGRRSSTLPCLRDIATSSL